jgi:ligand-binding sensor domain-containing protein
MRKSFSLLIGSFLLVFASFSVEKVSFKHYSVEDGLSQNTVMAILQDRKGFMWFGTWDGLNKFDGYQFTIFKSFPGDNSKITTNRIDLIHEDKAGYIWIQTYDGKFHRFDPGTEKFTSFSETSNRYSYGIERKKRFFESSNGDIWIATNELGAIRAYQKNEKDGLRFQTYSTSSDLKINSNKVNFILEDTQKNIWMGTDKGLFSVTIKNEDSEAEEKISNNAFYSAFITKTNLFFGDKDGNIWIIKINSTK